MLKIKCCLIFVVVALIACNEPDKIPKDVIQPDEMAEILADMQLVESILKVEEDLQNIHKDSLNLYTGIFANYGINKEQFQNSMVFYSNHPDKMEKIYDKTIVILNEEQASFGKDAN